MCRGFSTASSPGRSVPLFLEHCVWSGLLTCQCPLPLLCFQSLPTIKFCNSFVLITMQIAPRVWYPLSVSLAGLCPCPPSLPFLCFHTLTNTPICKPFVFQSLQQWEE